MRGLHVLGLAGAMLSAGLAAPSAAQDDLPEAVGRAFLEAEAKSYVKAWLDSHPPVSGVNLFGAKTVFVLELLMAADDYRRADTDKQRFHAASNGAVAFVAYSYAATPAVGLIVTAVWMCAQIVEAGVAGSYAEAMLAIQKDIILTEQQRQTLLFKSSLARAYRILVLIDGVRDLMERNKELETQFTADCSERAGSFEALAGCMDLLTQLVAQRRGLVGSLDGVLALPDEDLALLGEAASSAQPPAKSLRERLRDARNSAEAERQNVDLVYQPMSGAFAKLAAGYLESEALEEEQRLSASTAVEASCRARRTMLSKQAVATIADLARISQELKKRRPPPGVLAESRSVRATANDLLTDYAQAEITCSIIARDHNTAKLMGLLRAAASL